ncbi:MAG: YceI family protein [Winogradskyella sp.]|uniref:YceI family protein n=1 Tax=Winogradskyella sp. TaxID=1883156 RepID=UPI00385CEC69
MKTCCLLIVLVCVSLTGFSQNKSRIDFEISNLGIDVDGYFNSFSVTTKFNEATATLERISGSIKVASLETGIDSRDEHLLEEDYFNVEKHPTITLQSESVTKVSDNQYTVKANLKIKGITKLINIKLTVSKTETAYKITSNFEINRRDFDVGGSSFVMSKTVRIKVIHYQKF